MSVNFADTFSILLDITMNNFAEFANNTLFPRAAVLSCNLSDASLISNNRLISGSIDTVDFGTSAFIQGCIINGGSIKNKTLDVDSGFINCDVLRAIDQAETLSFFYEDKYVSKSGSSYDKTVDITGLTALDCLPENNYIGIFIITSGNATESIDSISNFPTSSPFIIRPAAGLALTITGTAISGIAAGQFALTSADVILNGGLGEYAIFEANTLGGGYVREVERKIWI